MKTLSLAEAQAAVRDYFGNIHYTLDSYNVGKFVYLDITYQDFRPSRQVRRDIEDLVPNATVSVERLYSDDTYSKNIKFLGLGNSDDSFLEVEFYLLDKAV